ncbi:NAD(P)/FAD-dependent oxidoreductase [Prauserella muralis]|uniref:Thioredoxin reductase n=1 Tax=Prauserella muralis TaxID=588067 RepID=A0A2V4AMF2_9PSEU|nr:NAD(P)/FAD-dependent oxidoreductase [Prauserella muralis]PXY21382.1 thioredoxin reductase [Prauserella muralis]TWE29716.1 thioredoxin reductase [Prauserella muralis]
MTEQELMGNRHDYDVVIVGGGAAGLSAALTLGRVRRSVLVVDSGQPRNAPAEHMHGFLSRDGMPPGSLLERGRHEVAAYGVTVVTGAAVSASGKPDDFTVVLGDERRVRARRLLVTTGGVDELPDVEGLAARWGRDVVHCPYCHGWEVRDERIGVLATGPMSVHQALLFRQLSDDVTLLPHTAPAPAGEEAEQLAARGIAVVPGEVTALEVTADRLTGVRLTTGQVVPVGALAVASYLRPRAELLAPLGLKPEPHPSGMGEYIPADANGLTAVPGVWAAGNVTDLSANVIASTAAGARAGAMINADLIAAEARAAVSGRRQPFSHEAEARNAERVLGTRGHGLATRQE